MVAPTTGRATADAAAPATTYTVEVEEGLSFLPAAVARRVDATLTDDRGWSRTDQVVLRRVPADPELRVLVATPGTTDDLCAPLQTQGRVSCRIGGLVVINARRWATGTADYRGDLLGYRRYVINHEVGHALGKGHDSCPAPGAPAPVMAQQSYGLGGCVKNPWPVVGARPLGAGQRPTGRPGTASSSPRERVVAEREDP